MNAIKTKKKGAAMREVGIIAIILIIYIIVGLIEPRFFSFDVVVNILLFTPVLLLISLGEMMEIISQNLDVSVGSIMGFTATVGGMVFRADKSFPIIVVFLLTTVIGIALGLFNGLLVTRFRLPSVIVTLGTMNIFRGLIFILMKAKQIDNMYIPQDLIALSQPMKSIIGIPYIVIIAFAAAALVALFLKRFKTGREIYAIGCNREAAQIRGINATKISLLVFCIAGGLSGFAAMLFISRVGYVNPVTAGSGMEFTAVAAAVIGGTSMAGGSGTTLGTVLGCLLLGVIFNSISYIGISGYWQDAIYGAIIIIAVIIEKLIKRGLMKGQEA
jgi:rhamnose transport system permease protein